MASDSQRPLLEEKEEFLSPSYGSTNGDPQPIREYDVDKPHDVDQADDQSKQPVVSYSMGRARWVPMFVLLLYALSMFPASYVLSLYLTYRWSREANVSLASASNSCVVNHSDPLQQAQDKIQSRVSDTTMYLGYALSLPAVVSSILMGTYSDVIGRRKTFIMPLVGAFAKGVVYIMVVKYDLNTNFLYLGNFIEGMGGSFYVCLIVTFSITADINKRKSGRVFWINIIMCFNQVVLAAYVIAIGVVVDRLGFVDVYIMCIVPIGMAILTVFFLLPETRPEKKKGNNLNFIANVGRVIGLYTSQGSKRHRLTLFLCLLIFFFAVINAFNISSIDSLYQMLQPLCWDASQITLYGAANRGIIAIAGTILMSIVMPCRCISHETLAMLGLLFQGASFVLESFVKNTWMMYMVPVVGFPSFPVSAIIRGVMSMLVGPYNQGALFASIAIIEVFSNLTSTTALFRVYSATVDYMPGAVYLLMAAFCLLTTALFVVYFYVRETPPKREMTLQVDEEGKERQKVTSQD